MAANQVDFKILPSDQFSVYSPQTRSDKVITYFTLLSKLRGDILSVGQDDDPNNIVSAFYSSVGGTQTLHLVKADGSEVTASVSEPTVGTVTSVGTSAPLTGGTITTTGTIGITQSSITTDGYLSSANFVIFNNKQGTITLTTTGSTGAATFISNTLNIPNYEDQFLGTVTSVAALTLGTTGTDLSSSVVNSTTTPVITLNVPTASATNRGALSSADWTTFNSKEPALTKGSLTEATSAVLTITGGTGAVIGTGTSIQVAQSGASASGFLSSADWTTFNSKQGALIFSAPLVNTSGTVSIPAATGLVDGYLSAANFATFNGKQDAITLTTTGTTGAATLIGATLNIPNYSNQFVGTVTSVDMSVPTGFAISGNPITNSGTLAVAFAAGYSLPTNASQTTWDTAYNDSITAFAYNTSNGVLTLTQQDAGTLTATVTLQPFSTTNLAEGTNLYYTDTRSRLALSAGTGITYDSATGVITNSSTSSGGTVTSVAALTIGTTGTDLSSSVVNGTTTPVITLQVPTASATNRGALSSTDWTTFNGKASNSFTTIAVATQNSIVADTATDTLTIVAGAGISLTTNDSTDTLTITNTAATSIACFAAYSTTTLVYDIATQTEVSLEFDEQSVINSSFYTHSTTVNPNVITILSAGLYEISFGYSVRNEIPATILSVGAAVAVNGTSSFTPFSFMQLNKPGFEIDTVSLVNTYIYNLAVNDDIEVYVSLIDAGGAITGTFDVNPFGLSGSTYITIKKLS